MEEFFEKLWGSIVGRPYVWAFLFGYVICATWQIGFGRMLALIPAGYLIAFASEHASITTGFPYGWYVYRYDALANDLLVGSPGVPFFDSISYVFMCFAGWVMAYALLGPMRREPGSFRYDIRWAGETRERRRVKVIVLGAFLTMWLDVVIDPVTHRGDEWFLGLIYNYGTEVGGSAIGPTYFGIALTNFGGWFLTALVIITAYALIDAGLDRLRYRKLEKGRTLKVPRHGDGAPMAGLCGTAIYYGVVLFGLFITAMLAVQRLGAGNTDGGLKMILLLGCGVALHAPFAVWYFVRIRRIAKQADDDGAAANATAAATT